MFVKGNNIALFFTEKDPLSNWFRRDFVVKGVKFNCMEQYMMYAKAKLFKDDEAAQRILVASHPAEQKKFGRQVKNYDDAVWCERRERIVFAGALEKFRQHEDLLKTLMITGGSLIGEASPSDKVWGIGLSITDPLAQDPANWVGTNLLGKVLMRVRAELGGVDGQEHRDLAEPVNKDGKMRALMAKFEQLAFELDRSPWLRNEPELKPYFDRLETLLKAGGVL